MKAKWFQTSCAPFPSLAAVVFLFVSGGKFSPEDILSHSPSTPFLIVLFILILYALKSLSVFFPVIVLQVAVGLLFQSFWAVLLNIAGMAVAFALPYAIGYYSGAAMVTAFGQTPKGSRHD